MILFFIGVLEMIIVSYWTKLVSETRVMASGMVSVVNIFIWYYVLQAVIEDVHNVMGIVVYAAGCGLGTMITTGYCRYVNERKAEGKPSESLNHYVA